MTTSAHDVRCADAVVEQRQRSHRFIREVQCLHKTRLGNERFLLSSCVNGQDWLSLPNSIPPP